MNIKAIKLPVITEKGNLLELVTDTCKSVSDNSVIAISAKIVSICDGSVASSIANKDELIQQQSQLFIPSNQSIYGTTYTINKSTLMRASGIDESNANGKYILWPKDPLGTAKKIHQHIVTKYNLKHLGVLIVDSTSMPMRIGTTGTSLAHWGFSEIKDYRNMPDLFGRPMKYSQANVAEAFAATSVFVMGEGAEQTPIVQFSEVENIEFNSEIGDSCYKKSPELYKTDIFETFLTKVNWQKGKDYKA